MDGFPSDGDFDNTILARSMPSGRHPSHHRNTEAAYQTKQFLGVARGPHIDLPVDIWVPVTHYSTPSYRQNFPPRPKQKV
jgi:hypothetical protein